MNFLGINQFNSERMLQFQAAGGNNEAADSFSLFVALASKINGDLIENKLKTGLSEDSIISQLLSQTGIDSQNDDLIEFLTDELSELVEQVQQKVQKEKINPQNTENETGWNLQDTGNIFEENISKENFLQNLDTLNEQSTENDYFSGYLNAINEAGGENFFNTLDANGDGILDKSELDVIINSDNDSTAISLGELNDILDKIPTKEQPSSEVPADNVAPDIQETDTVPEKTSTDNSGKTKHSHSSDNASNNTPETTTPKETVEDLIKQKQQVISDSDKQISELNGQIDTLISNSNADEQLKNDYNNAKTAFDDNQKNISDNESKIDNYDVDIHEIDTSVAALEGELNCLKTDTDDEQVNKTNAERKETINAQLTELKNKKEALEQEKQNLENTNNDLKSKSPELQAAVDNTYKALEEVLSDDVKQQISELKSQIQTIEANKTSKVQELDSKISALKTQEIEDSKKSGEAVGKLASNSTGAKFVQDALKYLGMKGGSKFSTGDYGWCADFVTYVVKEVARSMGMSAEDVKKLGHEHLGASPQKLARKNQGHVIETEGKSAEELSQLIQPGMAFICKGGGQSGQHTGFVAEVYSDGTFLSIEGNHGNKVCQVRRNIADMYRYVDFTYLLS